MGNKPAGLTEEEKKEIRVSINNHEFFWKPTEKNAVSFCAFGIVFIPDNFGCAASIRQIETAPECISNTNLCPGYVLVQINDEKISKTKFHLVQQKLLTHRFNLVDCISNRKKLRKILIEIAYIGVILCKCPLFACT